MQSLCTRIVESFPDSADYWQRPSVFDGSRSANGRGFWLTRLVEDSDRVCPVVVLDLDDCVDDMRPLSLGSRLLVALRHLIKILTSTVLRHRHDTSPRLHLLAS
jgi:hypothetical protein